MFNYAEIVVRTQRVYCVLSAFNTAFISSINTG